MDRFVTTSPRVVQRAPEECEGFDRFAGRLWVYPNNLPIRSYQKLAVEKALFHNAMIVLPTGMGKTFIAAVVMYNFHRWYPTGKLIFVAPTRPLVAQQIEECKKISGIPSSCCIELTGHTPSEKRKQLWQSKRVFFATPQVIENDLDTSILPATQIRCLVIDEAHRAQGGYAYVGIVKKLHERNKNKFRVLALSATPGSDIEKVQQVMLNLLISEVVFRNESALDLMPFKNAKTSKAWQVKLQGKHKDIVERYIKLTSPIYKELCRAGLTYSNDSVDKVAKYLLIKAVTQAGNADSGAKIGGKLRLYCNAAISLTHQFELLTIYGIRVFYKSAKKAFEETKSAFKTAMAGNVELERIMNDIKEMFGEYVEPLPMKDVPSNVDLIQGHPKLFSVKDLLMKHFNSKEDASKTRAMVFTKYRDSVYDIVQTLRAYSPVIKAACFVGQGQANSKDGTGMTQKDQLQMIKDFKAGMYNVLVATCVAEEGLDIGEVDLIICYDTTSSPVSNTQRRGRTGRKRCGDVHALVTEGYEEKRLKKAGFSKRQVEDQLYKRENYMNCRYRDAPRMIPADLNPVCLEQKIFPVIDEEFEPKRKRTKKDTTTPQPSFQSCADLMKCKDKCGGEEESPRKCLLDDSPDEFSDVPDAKSPVESQDKLKTDSGVDELDGGEKPAAKQEIVNSQISNGYPSDDDSIQWSDH